MKYAIVFITLFVCRIAIAQPELQEALLCDANPNTKTQDQLNAAKSIASIYKSNSVVTSNLCIGWTNLGNDSIWYEVSDDPKVYVTDVSKNKYVGSRPIKNDSCASGDEDCEPLWWDGRWGRGEVLEPQVIQRMQDSEIFAPFEAANEWTADDTLGCMGNNPLRYGDLDQDGSKELVLIFTDSFVIFSIAKNKTIFSVMWDVDDWLSREQTVNEVYEANNEEEYPQYASKMLYTTGNGFDKAYRGYAKLYFGDFDDDDSFDIVVWRKLYESRLQNDSIQGFSLQGDTLVHYAMVDGEYQKAETKPEDIKSWLSSRQLIWKKGYPIYSECEGKEGKLIAEMHDPLLNDPDVLQ